MGVIAFGERRDKTQQPAFFLAEMGDRSQIATVTLTARYLDVPVVVVGTTLGMLIADVPAMFLGTKIAQKVLMTLVHGMSEAVFAVLGVLTLCKLGRLF